MCANGHYNIYSAINSIDDEKNICWTSIYRTWYLFDHSFSIVSLLNKERMEIICTCCSEILSIFGWVKCWKSGSVNASMFHEIRRMSNHRKNVILFVWYISLPSSIWTNEISLTNTLIFDRFSKCIQVLYRIDMQASNWPFPLWFKNAYRRLPLSFFFSSVRYCGMGMCHVTPPKRNLEVLIYRVCN